MPDISDETLRCMELQNEAVAHFRKFEHLMRCAARIDRADTIWQMRNICGLTQDGAEWIVGKPLPSDYEACGDCGFDHSYEPAEAHEWHTT